VLGSTPPPQPNNTQVQIPLQQASQHQPQILVQQVQQTQQVQQAQPVLVQQVQVLQQTNQVQAVQESLPITQIQEKSQHETQAPSTNVNEIIKQHPKPKKLYKSSFSGRGGAHPHSTQAQQNTNITPVASVNTNTITPQVAQPVSTNTSLSQPLQNQTQTQNSTLKQKLNTSPSIQNRGTNGVSSWVPKTPTNANVNVNVQHQEQPQKRAQTSLVSLPDSLTDEVESNFFIGIKSTQVPQVSLRSEPEQSQSPILEPDHDSQHSTYLAQGNVPFMPPPYFTDTDTRSAYYEAPFFNPYRPPSDTSKFTTPPEQNQNNLQPHTINTPTTYGTPPHHLASNQFASGPIFYPQYGYPQYGYQGNYYPRIFKGTPGNAAAYNQPYPAYPGNSSINANPTNFVSEEEIKNMGYQYPAYNQPGNTKNFTSQEYKFNQQQQPRELFPFQNYYGTMPTGFQRPQQ